MTKKWINAIGLAMLVISGSAFADRGRPGAKPGLCPGDPGYEEAREEASSHLENTSELMFNETMSHLTEHVTGDARIWFIYSFSEEGFRWDNSLNFLLETVKKSGEWLVPEGSALLSRTSFLATAYMFVSDLNSAGTDDLRAQMIADIQNGNPWMDAETADLYASELLSYWLYSSNSSLRNLAKRYFDMAFGSPEECFLHVPERPKMPTRNLNEPPTVDHTHDDPGDILLCWDGTLSRIGPAGCPLAPAPPPCSGDGLAPASQGEGFNDCTTVVRDDPGREDDGPNDDRNDQDDDGQSDDGPFDDNDGNDGSNIDRDGDGIPDDWQTHHGCRACPPRGWSPHDGICETNLIQAGGRPPWVHCGGGGGGPQSVFRGPQDF